MFWLFDSRDRCRTDKRAVYQFPSTQDGLHDAWRCVVARECPDEWEDYSFLISVSERGDWLDECQCFNDYWACYGWCLSDMEDNAKLPDDCTLITTGV